MSTKAGTEPGRLDTIKLVAAVAVFVGGLLAYYIFADSPVVLRIIGLLVAVAVGVGIAFTTAQGRDFWGFVQNSQVELRKVVWPDRKETINTTLLVLGLTAIVATFFLVIDTILLKLTQFITGQGG